MKYFITGGSGFIGSHVVVKLVSEGHTVLALARSDTSAEKLKAIGAQPLVGDLQDPEILTKGAKESDGVIHLGWYSHTDFGKSTEIDKMAITTIGNALEGSNKPFIGTSGTLSYVFCNVDIATEDTPSPEDRPVFLARLENEFLLLSYAAKDVRTVNIRLAPTVHKKSKCGFIPNLLKGMHAAGVVVYAGDGDNVWPSAHVEDIADLYALALQKAAANTILHGVAEEAIPVKHIAEAIGEKAGLKVASVPVEELKEIVGDLFGFLFSSNNRVSSAKTRKLMGWNPTRAGFVEDYTS